MIAAGCAEFCSCLSSSSDGNGGGIDGGERRRNGRTMISTTTTIQDASKIFQNYTRTCSTSRTNNIGTVKDYVFVKNKFRGYTTRSFPCQGLEDFLPPEGVTADNPPPVYGRAWKAKELRNKSFTDLHALWYILSKERNALTTEKYIYRQQRMPSENIYNKNVKNKMQQFPASHRVKMVRQSMARIKTILTQRANAFEDEDVKFKLKKIINYM